jgi:hypothetical protein
MPMKSRIEVTRTHRRGGAIIHTGIYRVPEDIAKADADAVVAAGDAVALDAVKKEAPQNKSFRAAPENKVAEATVADSDSGSDRPVTAKPRRANKKRK